MSETSQLVERLTAGRADGSVSDQEAAVAVACHLIELFERLVVSFEAIALAVVTPEPDAPQHGPADSPLHTMDG